MLNLKCFFACIFLSAGWAHQAFAAPKFNIQISKDYYLPTEVYPGHTVSLYFTIENKTQSALKGYQIRDLPNGVSQNTANNTFCQNPINLQAKESCTLQLDISAPTYLSFELCKGASCTNAGIAISIALAKAPPVMFSAGAYNTRATAHPYYFFIETSYDGGSHWRQTIDSSKPQLPADFYRFEGVGGAGCLGSYCMATEVYQSNAPGHALNSLILTSEKNATHWKNSTPSFSPSDAAALIYKDVACEGKRCFVFGYYSSNGFAHTYPVIVKSNDDLSMWHYINRVKLPLHAYNSGLYSGSCSGKLCIGVGAYVTTSGKPPFYPMILTSLNKGSTWIDTLDRFKPAPPKDFKQGLLQKSHCVGKQCNAVGFYTSNSDVTTQYPLIATSFDGAKTWIYTLDSSTPMPQDFNRFAQLSSMDCALEHCVAVGTYNSLNSPREQGLAAFSANGGKTWRYTLDSSKPGIANIFNGSSLSNVACTGLQCNAAGYYITPNNDFYPLIATSLDGGETWSYTINSLTPALPTDYSNDGYFNKVNCVGVYCIAVGSYTSTEPGNPQYPLIARSTNGGRTWSFLSKEAIRLPSNYFNSAWLNFLL